MQQQQRRGAPTKHSTPVLRNSAIPAAEVSVVGPDGKKIGEAAACAAPPALFPTRGWRDVRSGIVGVPRSPCAVWRCLH
jgi:hypothetical protein